MRCFASDSVVPPFGVKQTGLLRALKNSESPKARRDFEAKPSEGRTGGKKEVIPVNYLLKQY